MIVYNINLTNVQETLVSGTNIKTINGNSLLGSGDLIISGGGSQNLQQVTDVGAVTTVIPEFTNGITFWDVAAGALLSLKTSDANVEFKAASNPGPFFNVERAGLQFGVFDYNEQVTFGNQLLSANRVYELPDQAGTIALTSDLAAYQLSLVSGTNIKTINGSSILGSGNLVVSGGDGIYAGSGIVPSSVDVTITDKLTFEGSLFVIDNTLYELDSNTRRFTIGNNSASLGRIAMSDNSIGGELGLIHVESGSLIAGRNNYGGEIGFGFASFEFADKPKIFVNDTTGFIGLGNLNNPTKEVDINGELRVRNIINGGTPNDFVTTDTDGIITRRTAAETLDDIGGQDALISGTNIKTINGASLLGSGNIVVIVEASTSPNTIADVWSGTQAEYDAIPTKSATTIYFVE